jgi:D-xylose transport system substrate-binding protein
VRKFPRKTVAIFGVFAAIAAVAAGGAAASHRASIQVCVLLPDTKSSVRWVQFDKPDIAKALKAAGVTYSINNALNDPLKQKAQAQACLAAGAKVVIETALDNGSAASIEKLFTSKGGKAIDYDRQVTGGSASVYVTFDGKAVGEAQANGVVAAMKANGTYKKSSVVAELWGGQTDQNAFWFKSGNDATLNPLFKSGAL